MSSPRLALITMVMERDFPHAKTSLATLEPQLGVDRHHFILVNDRPDATIPLDSHRYRTVIWAGSNLGVARGRNRLISEALRWDADLIGAFDDDLLAPTDYLEVMLEQWLRLGRGGKRPGVVAPALLDYHSTRDLLFRESDALQLDSGEYVPQRTTYEVKRVIARREPSVPKRLIFHMGIRNWQLHYLRPSGQLAGQSVAHVERLVDDYYSIEESYSATSVRNNPAARSRVTDPAGEPLAVDTLPGGVAWYSTDLIRDIGLMDEAFSPFAFEDSEFAIRAIEAGFENYVIPAALLTHDFQARLRERPRSSVVAARGKMRTLITRAHAPIPTIINHAVETITLGLIDAWDRSYFMGGGVDRLGPPLASVFQYLASAIHGALRTSNGPTRSRTWDDIWLDMSKSVSARRRQTLVRSETEILAHAGEISDPSASVGPYQFDVLELRRGRGGTPYGLELDLTVVGGAPSDGRPNGAPRLDANLRIKTIPSPGPTEFEFSFGIGGEISGQLKWSANGVGTGAPEPEADDNVVAVNSAEVALAVDNRASLSELRDSLPDKPRSAPANESPNAARLLQSLREALHSGGFRISFSSAEPIPLSELASLSDRDFATRFPVEVSTVDRLSIVPEHLLPEILFAPHNAYHAGEMLMVAAVLSQRGYSVAFVDITDSYRDEGVRARLDAADLAVYHYSTDLLRRLRPRCLFVMNDWGGPPAEMVQEATGLDTITFALIEGVQDFRDTHVEHLGIGRVRLPYTRSDIILLVGEDDQAYLPGKETYVTGSARIAKLATEAATSNREPLAVLNANFTYGIYSDHEQQWIDESVQACQAVGLEYVISQHHADSMDLSGYNKSNNSLYDELRRCSVLISRFSGAILEAMALGTPVIYFNPHGERMDKFKGDHGAFPVANSQSELVSALQFTMTTSLDELATRQRPFFERHVSIVDDKPVPERIADVIEERGLARANSFDKRK